MGSLEKLEKLYDSYVCVCDADPNKKCISCQIGNAINNIAEITYDYWVEFKDIEQPD